MEWSTNLAVAVTELTKYDFILAYVTEDIKKQKEIANAIRDPWFSDLWLQGVAEPDDIIREWSNLADSLIEKYEENPKKFKMWLHSNVEL